MFNSNLFGNNKSSEIPQSVGRLFIIALICVIEVVTFRATTLSQSRPRSIGGGFYQVQMPTVSSPLAQGQNLEISVVGDLAISGILEITVADVSEVNVEISSAFRADDEDQASETMSSSGAKLHSTEVGLELVIWMDPSVWTPFEDEKPSLEIVVIVPLETSIKIEAPYLRISTDGALSNLTIEETFEPVDIRGARGIVKVNSRTSAVSLTNLIGGFDIRTSNGKITLTDIEVLENVVSRARTEDAHIEIKRYSGPINVRTARAELRARELSLTSGRSRIENSGGVIDVVFKNISETAQLDVRNSYEDILLKFNRDLSAVFSLRASEGKAIEFLGMPHKILDVREDRIEAESGAGDVLINVRAKYGGAILISGRK